MKMKVQSLAAKFRKVMPNASVHRKGEVVNLTEKGVDYQIQIVEGNLEVWRDGNILCCCMDNDSYPDAVTKAAKLIVLDALGVVEANMEYEDCESDALWDDETVI